MSDCWLLSIPRHALQRHPEYPIMVGAHGTPYFWGDSDYSTQLVGSVSVGGEERVYWLSPGFQAEKVVRDLNSNTGEKVYVQRSIPGGFTEGMRAHVNGFLTDLRYREEFERHGIAAGA